MRRWHWLWFIICAMVGLVMLVCGLLIPAHLRAVDASVLQRAGRGTPVLVDQGLKLVALNKLGAAQMLSQAASAEKLPGWDKLQYNVNELAKQHPRWQVWGVPEPRFESIFEPDKRLPDSGTEHFTQYIIRQPNRDRILAMLGASDRTAVRELLRSRGLTNTVVFPASSSSSGQAFDAAVSICGLLLDGGYFSPAMNDAIFTVAAEANRSGDSEHLEQILMDLTSLSQRLNWGQLATLVANVQEPETLRLLANLARRSDDQLPILFSAVYLSSNPAGAADYLTALPQTGMKDLAATLKYGGGGLNELFRRKQQLHFSRWDQHLVVDCALQMPWFAVAVKWLLYLAAGFLLAAALHFALPNVSALERPLQVRGFHLAREFLFGLGFLLVILLATEPFLTSETQPHLSFPVIRLPSVGQLLPASTNHVNSPFMNKLTLLTMLLFFVLQGLLYTACLVKLAEIRRQRVIPRIKLRLLENEDHLFDAGLYLGFVGTIISLILVSIGVIKQPSLMAAYSSTSFGIIFVSFFKIVNLRPVRRKLLLEAEASGEPFMPTSSARLAAS